MKIPILALTFAVAGCSTVHYPPHAAGGRLPPHAAVGEWGVVRAESPAAARRFLLHLDDVAPKIAALPDSRVTPLDVRVVDRIRRPDGVELPPGVRGATVGTPSGSWIELLERATPEEERFALAHELVHLWLGPVWDLLSAPLEDGLANLVAESLAPSAFAGQRLEYVLALSTVHSGGFLVHASGRAATPGSDARYWFLRQEIDLDHLPDARAILAMDEAEMLAVMDRGRMSAIQGCGYLVVSRIGIERLRDLCVRAAAEGRDRVPAEQILAAAGLAHEGAWQAAIRALYGDAEREVLTRQDKFQWLVRVDG